MYRIFARPFFCHALWLALCLCLFSYGAAKAESITYTTTVPFVRTDWANSLSVPKFDPSLGILTTIEMTLTGAISGTVGVENEENNPITVLVQEVATERITLPDNTQLQSSGIVISQTVTLTGTDKVIDFGGLSGTTFPVVAAISNSRRLVTPSAIMPFVGTGQVILPATATVAWTGQGSGNMVFRLRHLANATLTVRYLYIIPAVTIKKFTNGFDADAPNAPDVPQLQPGSTVVWSYLVTNTGTITIPGTSLTVTDSQPGVTPVLDATTDVGSDNLLAPGEVWTFSATGMVEDLDAPTTPTTIVNGCNPTGAAAPGFRKTYQNIGVVTVPGAQAQDPSHYCNPAQPGIILKKYTNGFDADQPNSADVPELQPGAAVTWTYIVTNTGNITFALASVTVTDSQPGITPLFIPTSDQQGDSLLSPGERWRYVATGTVEDLDAPTSGITIVNGCNAANTQVPGSRPTYFNLGRVTVPGDDASDPSHYCNPPTAAIQLDKTVYRGHNAGTSCPGTELVADQINATITYCFVITNTGATYLDSLVFTDTILGIDLGDLSLRSGSTPLAPGAQLVYYYHATIPAGDRLNLAAVEANPTDDQGRDLPGLANPRDEDTAQVRSLPTGVDPDSEPGVVRYYLPLVNR